MTLINFSNIFVFIVWICLFIFLNVFGFAKKKSFYNVITLLLSIAFLIIHIVLKNEIVEFYKNVLIDFITLVISISLYIYVDEIEARREVISEVFENKYKNKKKK